MHTLAVTTTSIAPKLDAALKSLTGENADGVVIDAWRELRAGSLGETGRRQFLKRLQDRGLRVAGLHLPTRRSLYDQEELDGRINAIREAMDFAAQLRAPLLLIRAGHVPAADSPERELLLAVLSDLARHGNHVGTALALLPTNDSPESLHQFCEEVTTGVVGVELDPAAFVLSGHDPVAAARTLYDRLLHVRLRDAVRDVDGSGVEVAVGRGEVDWLTMLATLEEVGYSRWLTADRTTGDDRPGDTLRAVQYVRSVHPG